MGKSLDDFPSVSAPHFVSIFPPLSNLFTLLQSIETSTFLSSFLLGFELEKSILHFRWSLTGQLNSNLEANASESNVNNDCPAQEISEGKNIAKGPRDCFCV